MKLSSCHIYLGGKTTKKQSELENETGEPFKSQPSKNVARKKKEKAQNQSNSLSIYFVKAKNKKQGVV